MSYFGQIIKDNYYGTLRLIFPSFEMFDANVVRLNPQDLNGGYLFLEGKASENTGVDISFLSATWHSAGAQTADEANEYFPLERSGPN